jgi:hypothetical protein
VSLLLLHDTVKDLPFSLREQVVGYAESVDRAAPEIFRDVGKKYDKKLANRLVYLSGIKKLYGITSGTYWTLDNSATLLEASDIHEIRIGGEFFVRGAGMHQRIKKLVEELDVVLAKHRLKHLVNLSPANMLVALIHE